MAANDVFDYPQLPWQLLYIYIVTIPNYHLLHFVLKPFIHNISIYIFIIRI